MPTPIAPYFTQRNYSWTNWKTIHSLKVFAYQHEDDGTVHTVWGYDGPEAHITTIWKGDVPQAVIDSGYSQSQNDTDKADFTTNFLAGANRTIETRDSDSSTIVKTKTTKGGWHYEPRFIEFWSSTHNSLHNKKADAFTDYTDGVLKFFKANGDQLVKGAEELDADFQIRLDTDCVKTVMDWQPTYDMDIRAGRFLMGVKPTTPAYAYAMVAPDIPAAYGGSVPHVTGGAPLHMLADYSVIVFEGITVKNVLYDPIYNSNKFRIIITHTAGVKINMAVAFEHYKA